MNELSAVENHDKAGEWILNNYSSLWPTDTLYS